MRKTVHRWLTDKLSGNVQVFDKVYKIVETLGNLFSLGYERTHNNDNLKCLNLTHHFGDVGTADIAV